LNRHGSNSLTNNARVIFWKKRIYIILWNSLKSHEIKLTYLRRLSPKGGWITTVATTNSARTEGERCVEDAQTTRGQLAGGAQRTRGQLADGVRRRTDSSRTMCGGVRTARGRCTEDAQTARGRRADSADGVRTVRRHADDVWTMRQRADDWWKKGNLWRLIMIGISHLS